MRISVLSRHQAAAEGTAAGRLLHAWTTGMRDQGHEVDVTSWTPEPPTLRRPVRWLAIHGRAVVRPRGDAAAIGWAPAPGAVAVADDPVSFAAMADVPGAVATFHYLTALDARARPRARGDLQDVRAERAIARRARRVLAYSDRVARAIGRDAAVVPPAVVAPAQPLALVDRPVVGLIGQWDWPANGIALARLRACWPEVARRVPGARLLVAGRSEGVVDGVEAVPRAADFYGQLAVLAFPCPPTSGPKVKVLDAMAHGVAVLTTAAGVEGIVGDVTASVVGLEGFTDRLVALLRDADARASVARAGRDAITTHHSPAAAAAARAAALW